MELLQKKVRVYRSHVARLRHELSQRPLVAEESTFYLPSAIGWVVDGSAVSSRTVEPAEIRDNENGGEATKRRNGQLVKTGRQRSAASEQYWADRKGPSFLETLFLSADCIKIRLLLLSLVFRLFIN